VAPATGLLAFSRPCRGAPAPGADGRDPSAGGESPA